MTPLARVAVMHKGGLAFRGTEFCAQQTILALRERGVAVTLIAKNPPVLLDQLDGASIAAFQSSFPEIMLEGRRLRFPAVRYARELARLSRILRAARPSLILSSGGLPTQLGLPIARRLGVPIVTHVHHPAARRYFHFWLVRWADLVITPSRFTADTVRRGTGREPRVVPNGVDLSRFHPVPRDPTWRARAGIPADALVVVQVGALQAHKGIDVTLSALAQVARLGHPVHGLVIGDGAMREALEQQARDLGLEGRVTFTGRVAEVAPWLQHVADVHVMPSRAEGFGLVAAEAAACGLPNIVADNSALAEVVRDGTDGVLVRPNDPAGVAEALERMCRDPAWRARLGAAGAEHARSEYSVVRFRRQMIEVLEDAAARQNDIDGITRELLPTRGVS
jgi:glycosyltransferase involved in cell wall biosynthesis